MQLHIANQGTVIMNISVLSTSTRTCGFVYFSISALFGMLESEDDLYTLPLTHSLTHFALQSVSIRVRVR